MLILFLILTTSVFAQFPLFNLPSPRYNLCSASNDDVAVFVGGNEINGPVSSEILVYFRQNNSNIVLQGSVPRSGCAVANLKELFIIVGGVTAPGSGVAATNIVDILNITSMQITSTLIPLGRTSMGSTVTTNGKAFFAGGQPFSDLGISAQVDIFNYATNSFTSVQLSAPRTNLAAASAKNLVYFGGGNVVAGDTDIVEVFDAVSSSFLAPLKLSSPRRFLSAAAAGDFVFFAGGMAGFDPFSNPIFDTVDIVDVASGLLIKRRLEQAKFGIAATATKDRVIFSGGYRNSAISAQTPYSAAFESGLIEVIDLSFRSSVFSMNPRAFHTATVLGSSVLSAGGSTADVQALSFCTSVSECFFGCNKSTSCLDTGICAAPGPCQRLCSASVDDIAEQLFEQNLHTSWGAGKDLKTTRKIQLQDSNTTFVVSEGSFLINLNLNPIGAKVVSLGAFLYFVDQVNVTILPPCDNTTANNTVIGNNTIDNSLQFETDVGTAIQQVRSVVSGVSSSNPGFLVCHIITEIPFSVHCLQGGSFVLLPVSSDTHNALIAFGLFLLFSSIGIGWGMAYGGQVTEKLSLIPVSASAGCVVFQIIATFPMAYFFLHGIMLQATLTTLFLVLSFLSLVVRVAIVVCVLVKNHKAAKIVYVFIFAELVACVEIESLWILFGLLFTPQWTLLFVGIPITLILFVVTFVNFCKEIMPDVLRAAETFLKGKEKASKYLSAKNITFGFFAGICLLSLGALAALVVGVFYTVKAQDQALSGYTVVQFLFVSLSGLHPKGLEKLSKWQKWFKDESNIRKTKEIIKVGNDKVQVAIDLIPLIGKHQEPNDVELHQLPQ